MKAAIVIGATGITGKHITRCLLENDNYERVIVFSRRLLDMKHSKLCNHRVDFENIATWASLIRGDDLFSVLGTTRKQAGGKEAHYKVDYTYQAKVIEAAAKNNVKRLFLVSSPVANIDSKFFYARMKGQLEEFSRKQSFETIAYFKPTIIEAQRSDGRVTEKVGAVILRSLGAGFSGMKNYQPISGSQLAKAMVNFASAQLVPGEYIIERGKILEWIKPDC